MSDGYKQMAQSRDHWDGKRDAEIERLRAQLAAAEWEREALRELLREAGAPVRELLWCLTVWNDHNFTEKDLIRKIRMAREALGFDSINRVDDANDLLTRISAALERTEQGRIREESNRLRTWDDPLKERT